MYENIFVDAQMYYKKNWVKREHVLVLNLYGYLYLLNTGLGSKASSVHTHTKKQITDFPAALPASDVYSWAKAVSKPSYSWNEIVSKPDTFPPSSHSHDDRYYTETDIDNLLGGKAASSHTHSKGDVGLEKVDNTADADKSVAAAQFAMQLSHLRNIKIGNQSNAFNGASDISYSLDLMGAASKEHTHNYLPLTGGNLNGDVKISTAKKLYMGDWYIWCENSQLLTVRPSESIYGFFVGVRDAMWTICPTDDAKLTLGTPVHRFAQSYFSAPPITGSDRNQKKDIAPLSQKYMDFFSLLKPVTYRFIDGASGRIHIGFVSQDVEAAMAQVGLSDLDFAGFCCDKVDGTVIYSLRYEEFIALNTALIQRQQQQINSLEIRMDKLEKLSLPNI